MHADTIPPDATIVSIMGRLRNPEEYVRPLLGNMHACRKAHGNASVRIGVTGKGITPHYRVGYGGVLDFDGVKLASEEIPGLEATVIPGLEALFGAFDGRNHTRMDYDVEVLRDGHWSTKAMDYDEVAGLLGEVRARRGR
jgi:hypothetical protein